MAYLSGPLTITIQHDKLGSVYSSAGVPSIWGDSLVHEDIEGVDDNPVFVGEYTHTGEAQGPVDAPGGFKIGAGMVLGLIGVAAIAAAVLMPEKKRSNPRKKSRYAKRRARRRPERLSAQERKRLAQMDPETAREVRRDWIARNKRIASYPPSAREMRKRGRLSARGN